MVKALPSDPVAAALEKAARRAVKPDCPKIVEKVVESPATSSHDMRTVMLRIFICNACISVDSKQAMI